jgi:ABC-type protease/lipase transport system fused ATPase/permease subunit
MSERPQTLANHAKFDPLFHFVIAPSLLICFGFTIYFVIHRANMQHIWLAVFSLAVLLLATRCRMYALKVQDRVIRLEERLRLSALLPEPLKARIFELTVGQLIALRFASDGEIAELVERTLRENLEPKAIKQAIANWRPDYWRV